MTHIPYEPPERMYQDTILAFSDMQMASTWGARIDPDPLGPVNKIVSLMRGQKCIKSVLCPVPAGATVKLVRDEGSWTLHNLHAMRSRLWDTRGRNEPEPTIDINLPGWRIEVDGQTVLTVTDAEMHTPQVTPPTPRVPLWRRMRKAFGEQLRTDADAIAERLGYHRADDCNYSGWDE